MFLMAWTCRDIFPPNNLCCFATSVKQPSKADQKETLSKYAAFNLEANTGPICSPHLFYNDKCCCLQTSSALLRNLSESTFQKGPEEGYDKVLQDVTSGRWPDSSDPGPLSELLGGSSLQEALWDYPMAI
ncbi:uncharacterized protein [Aphelocoma coerulescens]|uniref:uncharacterized protein isoform X4 n=1 Tax=Aphelocoma coerulescens TaxID=39617 RepID=UPI00360454F5